MPWGPILNNTTRTYATESRGCQGRENFDCCILSYEDIDMCLSSPWRWKRCVLLKCLSSPLKPQSTTYTTQNNFLATNWALLIHHYWNFPHELRILTSVIHLADTLKNTEFKYSKNRTSHKHACFVAKFIHGLNICFKIKNGCTFQCLFS
jgi:hypothetical protein